MKTTDGQDSSTSPLLPIAQPPPPRGLAALTASLLTPNTFFILLGPLLCLLTCLFVRLDGAGAAGNRPAKMLGAMAWVFTWWMTEAVPMPVASMAPLFLYPVLGISSADHVAGSYMNDVIALVLGSFVLALAVQHYNIHKRLALNSPLLPISTLPLEEPTPSTVWELTQNTIFIVLGPVLSLTVCLFADVEGPPASTTAPGAARNMVAVMAWVFTWWLTKAVPAPVTSMSPLFLFPIFGIASAEYVASCYVGDVVSLVLGSSVITLAVEQYNVHKRLALNITMLFCGDPVSPRLLLLGICATTAFVSMWMHNVAAAMMMMPVATGILQRLPSSFDISASTAPGQSEAVDRFCRAVVLGVVYSSAIGGMSTITGTGVNLILVGMWKSYFPEADPISFSRWLFFGLPLAALIFGCMWGVLCFFYCSKDAAPALSANLDRAHLRRELELLGPMSSAEKMILSVFSMLIVLWMTRNITDDIPGWGALFNGRAGDGTASVMMATLLFIIPNNKQKGEKLMDWTKCKSLPWNIILLLGAGFALADGVRTSGLADVLSEALGFLEGVPYLAIAPAVCLISATITEFTSNNATTTLVVPLLVQIAQTMRVHPLLLMVPGAVGAQFAFLLPTGTPSNVVGFTTGHIEMKDMFKVGLPLKVASIAALSILMPTLGAYVFGTDREVAYPSSWLQKSMEHFWVNNH